MEVMPFLVKNCTTLSAVWEDALNKSPILKWANVLEESSKKYSWKPNAALTTMPTGTLIQMGS